MELATRAQAIDAEATALVATLPELPAERLAALAGSARAVAAATTGAVAEVAVALAEVVDCYRAGRAALEGWGVVAAAAHTLARGVAGGVPGPALAATRFELETLLPPRGPAAPRPAAPDVPLAALVRRT